MASIVNPHIELDERGIAHVAGTRHKVKMIVADRIAHGWSPEEIHFQYPGLSLAQIHAALSYYYDHRDDIDSQIENDHDEVRRLRAQDQDSPIRRRLREMGRIR
jgi:uncharacterized protein (DUF433 family)